MFTLIALLNKVIIFYKKNTRTLIFLSISSIFLSPKTYPESRALFASTVHLNHESMTNETLWNIYSFHHQKWVISPFNRLKSRKFLNS